MRRVAASLLLTTLMVSTPAVRPDAPAGDIEQLIVKLGSPKYAQREAAMRGLDQHGAAALKALQAATQHADPEVRHRANLLVQRIDNRLTITRMLTGKKIRLVYKDVLVLDAVNDLSAKAGFPIDVAGDRLGLRNRKITLDTGETTFWEAFDLFCQTAGLSERLPTLNPTTMMRNNPYAKPGMSEYAYLGNVPLDKNNQRIALVDSKAPALPTWYAGGLRLRAVNLPVPPIKDEYPRQTPPAVGFHLELAPEPQLAWRTALSLRIIKAIDDHGQHLVQPEPYLVERFADPLLGVGAAAVVWDGGTGLPLIGAAGPRFLPVRLQSGKKAARLLKEVHGTLVVELIGVRKLATVDGLATAQGKNVACADGSELKVLVVVSSNAHCDITVQVNSSSSAVAAGQGVRVVKAKNGPLVIDFDPPNLAGMFTLLDANGTALPLLHGEHAVVENGKRGLGVEYALKFQNKPSQSPLQLIYTGPKAMTVDIPFTLRDVPLMDNPQAGRGVFSR